jgi:hypothetical protein
MVARLVIHSQFERMPHLFKFTLAPDESGQPAPCGEIKVGPQLSESGYLITLIASLIPLAAISPSARNSK